MIGVFFGFFLGLFSLFDPLVSAFVLALIWLIYGAIIGVIVGLIAHALSGGRRDFSSVEGIQADHYNVMVDEEVAEEASRLLAELRTPSQPPSGDVRTETAPETPSRMGEEAGPAREEVSPETPRTGETPSREEPVTREETPPPGEERPERRTP